MKKELTPEEAELEGIKRHAKCCSPEAVALSTERRATERYQAMMWRAMMRYKAEAARIDTAVG